MGAADQRAFTSDQTLKELQKVAAEQSDDFILKVFRRTNLASLPSVIATFSGANVSHFTSPELWLPQLAGGGKYQLLGYHATDANKAVGSYLGFNADNLELRDVDIAATKSANWRGPVKLEFPQEPAPRNNVADMPLYGIQSPPAPGASDSATRSHAWPRPAGGGLRREQYDDVPDAFGAQARALEAERRKLEQEKLETERQKHRDELVATQKQHEADMRSLKNDLMAEIRAKEGPKGPDPVMTVLTEIMKQNAEDRRLAEQRAAEDRRAAETRQAEERRLAAEERTRADARFEKLIEKMGEKKERDPLEMVEKVANLIGKKNDGNDVLVKSVHNMIEMQSSTMGMAMDFVDHVSRMNLGGGEDEPAWVKGLDRLVKGVSKMAIGAGRAPALPPMGAPGAQTVPQRQPQQAQQQQQPQQPPQGAPEQVPPIIDQIEHAIRIHHPPHLVAAALIANYKDPSVQQALAQAGGDIEAALSQRLGPWLQEEKNAQYVQQLIAAVQKELQKAGLYVDEPEEEDTEPGDDEEDAELEDAEGDEVEE